MSCTILYRIHSTPAQTGSVWLSRQYYPLVVRHLSVGCYIARQVILSQEVFLSSGWSKQALTSHYPICLMLRFTGRLAPVMPRRGYFQRTFRTSFSPDITISTRSYYERKKWYLSRFDVKLEIHRRVFSNRETQIHMSSG